MSVVQIADAEHRLHLAQEALEAANLRNNEKSMNLHKFRVRRAEEALKRARRAEELGEA